jgi:hypothetical protein
MISAFLFSLVQAEFGDDLLNGIGCLFCLNLYPFFNVFFSIGLVVDKGKLRSKTIIQKRERINLLKVFLLGHSHES